MSITGYQTFNLYDTIRVWQEVGVYDIILPFILVFTISFAILQKVKIFGKEAKNVNVIVSLVLAFLFLQNTYLIFILQRFLPNVSIIVIGSLMFLLLIGIFSGEHSGWSGTALNIAFIFSLIAIIVALSVDFFPTGDGSPYGFLSWFYQLDPTIQSMIIFGILIVLVISIVTREKEEKGFFDKVIEGIKKK